MPRRQTVLEPAAIAHGWLAGIAAVPAALLLVAVGQGIGAALGGCGWIGISIPLHRPVWALVNQPTLHFAATPASFGYWWGWPLAAAAVAALVVGFLPRPRTVAWELAAVQLAWAAATAGLAWQATVDEGGPLAAWADLRGVDLPVPWLTVTGAAVLAIGPTVRLLALEATGRTGPPRWRRMLAVVLHLVVPTAVWGSLAVLLSPSVDAAAPVALAAPAAVAVGVAFWGVPPGLGRVPEPVGVRGVAAAAVALALGTGAVAVAGAPVGGDGAAAVLWGRQTVSDNIRPWVRPRAWSQLPAGAEVWEPAVVPVEDGFGLPAARSATSRRYSSSSLSSL